MAARWMQLSSILKTAGYKCVRHSISPAVVDGVCGGGVASTVGFQLLLLLLPQEARHGEMIEMGMGEESTVCGHCRARPI